VRTLGLIGGMSWESTALYYRLINEGVRARLGGLRSASLLLYSYNFEPIRDMQSEGRWDEAGDSLARTAATLEQAGAEAIVLATNTMHKVADRIVAAVDIPLLHIADATAERIRAAGLTRVALLGTRFTMEEPFYRERLAARGVESLVPPPEAGAEVNRVIYDELCRGQVLAMSRERYRRVILDLLYRGAEGVILGCTEITLLIGEADAPAPVFDTTAIHADAAAVFAADG
jgi:aspartate racemase